MIKEWKITWRMKTMYGIVHTTEIVKGPNEKQAKRNLLSNNPGATITYVEPYQDVRKLEN